MILLVELDLAITFSASEVAFCSLMVLDYSASIMLFIAVFFLGELSGDSFCSIVPFNTEDYSTD